MGVTIHYRGTVNDVSQVELMEDRLLDLVFSLGGQATIWRSFADHDPSRVVRGLLINLEPGQDTFSMLVSPEGHLTPLFQIEDAEKSPFDGPPYCFVKTQFGSLQGHVTIVHLLDELRGRFCSNLEVLDEGEYHGNRDIHQLARNLQRHRSAIDSMAEGLREHGLSVEAVEDPEILALRIERIANLVHQKMLSNRQFPPVFTDNAMNEGWSESSLEDDVTTMGRIHRHNDMRCERMRRRIAEATEAGLTVETAIELAMKEEGLQVPPRESGERIDSVFNEPWTESLPSHPFDETDEYSLSCDHPAVEQAKSFLLQVMNLEQGDAKQSSFPSILKRASLEIVGGLVQATVDKQEDNIHQALAITQLRRALSGHAYARGAVFGLRSENAISGDQSKDLHKRLELLLAAIHELLKAAWA